MQIRIAAKYVAQAFASKTFMAYALHNPRQNNGLMR
jgi:hypothetical protein